jgi:hypothetical protein
LPRIKYTCGMIRLKYRSTISGRVCSNNASRNRVMELRLSSKSWWAIQYMTTIQGCSVVNLAVFTIYRWNNGTLVILWKKKMFKTNIHVGTKHVSNDMQNNITGTIYVPHSSSNLKNKTRAQYRNTNIGYCFSFRGSWHGKVLIFFSSH